MDCSSLTELMLCERQGITGPDIMFSSNDTPAEDFALAAKLGATINLDDITHIDFLERTIGYIPETISCRFNPGGYFEISNTIMDSPGDAKYGMTKPQMFQAYRILMEKGAKEFGIHAFLASNTTTDDYYPTLAMQLFRLAVELHEETGAHIGFINLSGGVGIPYRPDGHHPDILAIGEGVRKVYEQILVPAGMGDVKIFTEMGRFMLGPYGCLVTKCLHQKHIHKEYIGVDACACNLMRPAMYGAYHHITVAGKEDAPCDHLYDVTGGLCENNDKFAVDRWLPAICPGDILVIHDTAPTATPWATTTTASSAAPRSCSARTAARGSSGAPRPRRTTSPRSTFKNRLKFAKTPRLGRFSCFSGAQIFPAHDYSAAAHTPFGGKL